MLFSSSLITQKERGTHIQKEEPNKALVGYSQPENELLKIIAQKIVYL